MNNTMRDVAAADHPRYGRWGHSSVDVPPRPELVQACRRAPSPTPQASRTSSQAPLAHQLRQGGVQGVTQLSLILGRREVGVGELEVHAKHLTEGCAQFRLETDDGAPVRRVERCRCVGGGGADPDGAGRPYCGGQAVVQLLVEATGGARLWVRGLGDRLDGRRWTAVLTWLQRVATAPACSFLMVLT